MTRELTQVELKCVGFAMECQLMRQISTTVGAYVAGGPACVINLNIQSVIAINTVGCQSVCPSITM